MRTNGSAAAAALALVTLAPALARAGGLPPDTHLSFEQPPAAPAAPSEHSAALHEAASPALAWPADPEWTVQIEPLAWFVGPSGKVKLPVNSGTGPAGFTSAGDEIRVNDLELDDTRLRPAGTLTIAHEKWRFAFTGAQYELSHSSATVNIAGRLGSVAFAPGDTLSVDFSFGMYEATAGYRIWDYDFKQKAEHPANAVDAGITLHLLGGVRFHDVEIGVSNGPARAEGSHVWVEPIVGARAEMVVARDFSLIVQLSGGGLPLGSTSSYSIDLQLAFQWRPTDNVGIQIGWRQLAFDLTAGDGLDRFEYDGRMAGLFAGVAIRF